MRLSGLSTSLWTKTSQVRFPLRAFLSLSFFLPSYLSKINKLNLKKKKKYRGHPQNPRGLHLGWVPKPITAERAMPSPVQHYGLGGSARDLMAGGFYLKGQRFAFVAIIRSTDLDVPTKLLPAPLSVTSQRVLSTIAISTQQCFWSQSSFRRRPWPLPMLRNGLPTHPITQKQLAQ